MEDQPENVVSTELSEETKAEADPFILSQRSRNAAGEHQEESLLKTVERLASVSPIDSQYVDTSEERSAGSQCETCEDIPVVSPMHPMIQRGIEIA